MIVFFSCFLNLLLVGSLLTLFQSEMSECAASSMSSRFAWLPPKTKKNSSEEASLRSWRRRPPPELRWTAEEVEEDEAPVEVRRAYICCCCCCCRILTGLVGVVVVAVATAPCDIVLCIFLGLELLSPADGDERSPPDLCHSAASSPSSSTSTKAMLDFGLLRRPLTDSESSCCCLLIRICLTLLLLLPPSATPPRWGVDWWGRGRFGDEAGAAAPNELDTDRL